MARAHALPLLTLLNPPTLAAYAAAGYWGGEAICRLAARLTGESP